MGRWLLLAGLLAPVALQAMGPLGEASPRVARFPILAGERVSDLALRWQEMGLSSPSDVTTAAGRETFALFPLVPPPAPETSRFEGLFLPGSYTIRLPARSAGETAESYRYRTTVLLIRTLLERASAAQRRLRPQHGLSAYQLLTLASIVQKEAASGTDYGTVASVFFNRLEEKMHLSSCPALEYALGYHRPFLTRGDLGLDSPYNTYRYGGLPPTPIAFCSPEALAAVQHPPRSPYLFFVFDWARPGLFFARLPLEHELQARQAEEDYARKHGADSLHRKYPGLFYPASS